VAYQLRDLKLRGKHPGKNSEFMKLNSYLNYGGNCAEAFRFYEQHLDGKITMLMTHAQMPDPTGVNPEWADKVLHARLELGGTAIYGADIPTPSFQPIGSAYLSLAVGSIAEAERIYALLSAGGEIFNAMGETFFAHRFATFRDRLGTSWMLLNEKPIPPNG
jgi:PhnB protein